MPGEIFAQPLHITDLAECIFYHTMDLPEVGAVPGTWDLRPNVGDYLGRQDFQGKRCLDIGSASGYLTFEMECRGACSVVSVDLDDPHRPEVVVFGANSADVCERNDKLAARLTAFKRSYWYAHQLLKSRARVYYGTAYNLPSALGMFDVVMLGMVLPHLRDPFSALEQAAARCETGGIIVVTQQSPSIEGPWAYFMPDPVTRAPFLAWWSMSEDCLRRMLMCLGFSVEQCCRQTYRCPGRNDSLNVAEEECLTIVARRS